MGSQVKRPQGQFAPCVRTKHPQNSVVAVVRDLSLSALFCFWLAGCQSGSELSSRLTTAPSFSSARSTYEIPQVLAPVTNVTMVPEEITIAPAAPLPAPAPLTNIATNAPLVAMNSPLAALLHRNVWPTNWVNVWIPLESWGK